MHSVEDLNNITGMVIGAAIEVHRHIGPGLLESAYLECMCEELRLRSITFAREQRIPVTYKGKKLDAAIELISWLKKPFQSSSNAWIICSRFTKPRF